MSRKLAVGEQAQVRQQVGLVDVGFEQRQQVGVAPQRVVPRSGSKIGWSSASMKVTDTAPTPSRASSSDSAWSGVMARRSCSQGIKTSFKKWLEAEGWTRR